MTRLLLGLLLMSSSAAMAADNDAGSRTVIGGNDLLASGAAALRVGRYDRGIELTRAGLEQEARPRERAAGLANLCAAYAAKRDPESAIEHCNASIELDARNWRAYSNRAFAHFLAGRYDAAVGDLDSAAALEADAPEIETIRAMIAALELRSHVEATGPSKADQLPATRAPAIATS